MTVYFFGGVGAAAAVRAACAAAVAGRALDPTSHLHPSEAGGWKADDRPSAYRSGLRVVKKKGNEPWPPCRH